MTTALLSDPWLRRRRREALRQHPSLMGIDYVEVVKPAPGTDLWTLKIYFIPAAEGVKKQIIPPGISRANIRMTTSIGDPAAGVQINGDPSFPGGGSLSISLRTSAEIGAATAGEYSPIYVLQLVDLPNLDPVFAQVTFTLRDAQATLDPLPAALVPVEPLAAPEIDYLARDFSSFRTLMLNRMSLLMPQWRERNPADLLNTLVDVVAYTADHLSYYQDAVATEAYLGTARRRVSLRRHARLLDYAIHEGCNARVWVQIQVDADTRLPAGTPLLTNVDAARGPVLSDAEYRQVPTGGPMVFETLHAAALYAQHNMLPFYTAGAVDLALPKSATTATLRGKFPNLQPGDVLIFAEVRGSLSGRPADADAARRHAVRLTKVVPDLDLLGGQFVDNPGTGTISSVAGSTSVTGNGTNFTAELMVGEAIMAAGQTRRVQQIVSDTAIEVDPAFPALAAGTPFTHEAIAITRIAWHGQDALPFALVVASQAAGGEPVGLALGNIVLADQGRWIDAEKLPPAPASGRYRPVLRHGDLTFCVPYDDTHARCRPAGAASAQEARAALPAITLEDAERQPWMVRRDLLGSGRFDRHFTVEMEDDGRAALRFGDGVLGKRPADNGLVARYRVGNGLRGNVGHDIISHVVSDDIHITGVGNPLPAAGGVDPESFEQVRLSAPAAIHSQQRCVTAADYVAIVERHPEVQQAAALPQWTGSWYTIFIAVDRAGGREIDTAFRDELRELLETYRLTGCDLEILGPRFVYLDIALIVHVAPGNFRAAVRQELYERFSSIDQPSGRRGFFHPDNFGFGQPVYLSRIIAAAMQVPGVVRVSAERFRPWGRATGDELAAGRIPIGPLAIARLDQDPRAPERGRIEFIMEGGL